MKNFSYILLTLCAVLLNTTFTACDDVPEVKPKQKVQGRTVIDLGLSVRWAESNVGAEFRYNPGDYFAWGEINPKEEYTEENSETYGLTTEELLEQGYIDEFGNMNPRHDPATRNWGSKWRTPTIDEINELLVECVWIWTRRDGILGYRVVGPNGNDIFLPAGGYSRGVNDQDVYGDYWCSTTYTGDTTYSYSLNFHDTGQNVTLNNRINGYSIRPVTE